MLPRTIWVARHQRRACPLPRRVIPRLTTHRWSEPERDRCSRYRRSRRAPSGAPAPEDIGLPFDGSSSGRPPFPAGVLLGATRPRCRSKAMMRRAVHESCFAGGAIECGLWSGGRQPSPSRRRLSSMAEEIREDALRPCWIEARVHRGGLSLLYCRALFRRVISSSCPGGDPGLCTNFSREEATMSERISGVLSTSTWRPRAVPPCSSRCPSISNAFHYRRIAVAPSSTHIDLNRTSAVLWAEAVPESGTATPSRARSPSASSPAARRASSVYAGSDTIFAMISALLASASSGMSALVFLPSRPSSSHTAESAPIGVGLATTRLLKGAPGRDHLVSRSARSGSLAALSPARRLRLGGRCSSSCSRRLSAPSSSAPAPVGETGRRPIWIAFPSDPTCPGELSRTAPHGP